MKRGFTLIELLVVIAIVAVLAALVLPAVAKAKGAARKTVCISNTRQINQAMLMYADDHGDSIRAITNSDPIYFSFRNSIQPYLSRSGAGTNDHLFICPSDDFNCDDPRIKDILPFDVINGRGFCNQDATRHGSYFFNGKAPDEDHSNMAQKVFATVREPARLILVGEISGGLGLSAHDRRQPYQFNNALNVLSFVDGHVSYIRTYWNGTNGLAGISFLYEPPVGYEYKWNPD